MLLLEKRTEPYGGVMKIFYVFVLLAFILVYSSPTLSEYKAYPGLELVSPQYIEIRDNVIITNMPQVRDQGGLPICIAAASSLIIEQATCRKDRTDCRRLPDDQRPSILDLMRFNYHGDLEWRQSDPGAYPKKIYMRPDDYGLHIMMNIFHGMAVVPESCAPSSSFILKNSDGEQLIKLEVQTWDRLQMVYDHYRKVFRKCRTCADEIAKAGILEFRAIFSPSTDVAQEKTAFSAESYESFLSKFLIPDRCYSGNYYYVRHNNYDWWPDEDRNVEYGEVISKIIEILKSGQPIYAAVCLADVPGRTTCTENGEERGHALVITGFQKMCNGSDCVDALRVENTWGPDWQAEYANGWIRARPLLTHLGFGRASLFWVQAPMR